MNLSVRIELIMQSEANKLCRHLLMYTFWDFKVLSFFCGVSTTTLRKIINEEDYTPSKKIFDKMQKAEPFVIKSWNEFQNTFSRMSYNNKSSNLQNHVK